VCRVTLSSLRAAVDECGGFVHVEQSDGWAKVAKSLELPGNSGTQLRVAYLKKLPSSVKRLLHSSGVSVVAVAVDELVAARAAQQHLVVVDRTQQCSRRRRLLDIGTASPAPGDGLDYDGGDDDDNVVDVIGATNSSATLATSTPMAARRCVTRRTTATFAPWRSC
jgi:hypothetical protein